MIWLGSGLISRAFWKSEDLCHHPACVSSGPGPGASVPLCKMGRWVLPCRLVRVPTAPVPVPRLAPTLPQGIPSTGDVEVPTPEVGSTAGIASQGCWTPKPAWNASPVIWEV